MGTAAVLGDTRWCAHPRAGDLLRFNLLPTRLFHPSRRGEWLPEAARPLLPRVGEAALHRHASAAMLRRLRLPMARQLDEPALPLCMAAQDLFDAALLHAGLAVLAPALRRVIARDEVLALREQLGDARLNWACARAIAWWPAELAGQPDGAPVLLIEDAHAQAVRLGAALAAAALKDAPAAVAERGGLRLPPQAQAWQAHLPVHWSAAPAALALVRDVMQELDAPWLSSFPTRG